MVFVCLRHYVSESVSRKKKTDRCIPKSIMQLPVGLDSGFFLCEAVFSTVLNEELIVSATMHWVVVFRDATGLDPRSWLLLWFCLFSGVSPTAVTPVPLHNSVLINKYNYTHQTGFLDQTDKWKVWTTFTHNRCVSVWLSVPLWWLCVNCIRCDVLRCCR